MCAYLIIASYCSVAHRKRVQVQDEAHQNQAQCGGLPVFEITGRDREKEFFLRLKAYTRAFWRFEQPRRMGMRSILYYNEYPAEVDEFRFRMLDGSLAVEKKNLGFTASNFEHSWGKLI